jgi:ABC-2 type transport system ATP-binding protein
MSRQEREKEIMHYSQMFEIVDSLAQPLNSYSHGMKQKIALIAALMHKPKLLLMDEPFVGLDPKATHLVKQEMRKLCNNGSSIFFSTHVLEVAEKLCDKIAIIQKGKLIVTGTVEEVKGNASLEDVFIELEGSNGENRN